jgi:hypothetical protein
MQQVSYWKQRETKYGAPKIEIMTTAMLTPPMHPRKHAKYFKQMSKSDHNQTPCAEQL